MHAKKITQKIANDTSSAFLFGESFLVSDSFSFSFLGEPFLLVSSVFASLPVSFRKLLTFPTLTYKKNLWTILSAQKPGHGTLNHHHHHHHRVACPLLDAAVPSSVLHAWWFYAQWQAVARPILSDARSDSMVQSQVWCGQPDWWFQSLCKGATQALRARLQSTDGSAHAMWLKNLRQVVRMMCVSDGWSVRPQTSSLEIQAL